MIKGINHITFSVSNLQKSFAFYKEVLDFKPLMQNAKSAYFLAGDLWFCLEEEAQVRQQELSEYTHLAFSVEASDFTKLSEKIIKSGTKIFKENKSEGLSLYFLDPDGHKLEIHVGDWQTRIKSYKSRIDLKDMKFFV